MDTFINTYFFDFKKVLDNFIDDTKNKLALHNTVNILKSTKNTGKVIYFIGNGGSCAVAEHMAIDFTKNAGLRAMAFSGLPLMTTFSNDYGYEKVFQKAVESFADKKDILIAISSSGTSKNILNGCKAAKDKGMKIITFSGFACDNPLRQQGSINFWINSRAFGYVELLHNLLLHYINDSIIGSAEYLIR